MQSWKFNVLALVLIVSVILGTVSGKVFKKCEVVKKLEENGVSRTFIPTFLCLSESESGMNSSAKSTTPSLVTSYGIFQVK